MGAHNRKNRVEQNKPFEEGPMYRAFLNAPKEPKKHNINEDHQKNADRTALSEFISNCKKIGREAAGEMHNLSRLNFDLIDLEDALMKTELETSKKFNEIGLNLQVYYHHQEPRKPKLRIIIEGSKECTIDSSAVEALAKYNLILVKDKCPSLKEKVYSLEQPNFNFIFEKHNSASKN
jgi:hypothetical protein